MAKMTPNCAEHGTAKARSNVEITRSRLVSCVLVTIVAIVLQPNPSTIGITALPLSPIFLKTLSTSMDNRGRYPLSSITENTRKNVPTMGSIIATAYVMPKVMIPYSPTIKSCIGL